MEQSKHEAQRQHGGRRSAYDTLRRIEGIGEAPGDYGRDHDALLYGDESN